MEKIDHESANQGDRVTERSAKLKSMIESLVLSESKSESKNARPLETLTITVQKLLELRVQGIADVVNRIHPTTMGWVEDNRDNLIALLLEDKLPLILYANKTVTGFVITQGESLMYFLAKIAALLILKANKGKSIDTHRFKLLISRPVTIYISGTNIRSNEACLINNFLSKVLNDTI